MAKRSTLILDFSSRIDMIKMNLLPKLSYVFLSLRVRIPESQFSANEYPGSYGQDPGPGQDPRPFTHIKKGGPALPSFRHDCYAAHLG